MTGARVRPVPVQPRRGARTPACPAPVSCNRQAGAPPPPPPPPKQMPHLRRLAQLVQAGVEAGQALLRARQLVLLRLNLDLRGRWGGVRLATGFR